jgi:glucose dehydrogenase
MKLQLVGEIKNPNANAFFPTFPFQVMSNPIARTAERILAAPQSDPSANRKVAPIKGRGRVLRGPGKTTHLGRPVGKDSGINTRQGDQWKLGGGKAWGLVYSSLHATIRTPACFSSRQITSAWISSRFA